MTDFNLTNINSSAFHPNMKNKMTKVVPIIYRKNNTNIDLLVFRHPLAGIQMVKGTVEEQEELSVAALRELKEESGIQHAKIEQYLGVHYPVEPGPDWHVFQCVSELKLSEKWDHFCEDDGGLVFSFFWHPLFEPPTEEWHPLFKALLKYIQQNLDLSR